MFAAPGIFLVLVLDYLKPQEFIPILATLPLLYIFTGLALLGLVIDIRLRLAKIELPPQLALAIVYVVWCLATDAVTYPSILPARVMPLLIPMSLFVLVGLGVQTFRMLEVLAAFTLAICLFLAGVGVHQGLAPFGCHRVQYAHGATIETFDGRDCDPLEIDICEREGAEPGADYTCERVGLLGTSSVAHGRVRYRGTLADPNELALALGIALPFAFAIYERRRSFATLCLLASTLALIGACAVFTQSRGGQVVFLAVLGVYFVRKYGLRGLIIGAVLAMPIVLLGGRSDSAADASSLERTECWYEGMRMFIHSPLYGVGSGLFLEHHTLTAHNSYVLAAAELGFPGLLIWSALMYHSIKIPWVALKPDASGQKRPPLVQAWAVAILASMTGLLAGVFFLSFIYKEVLWIYVGLTAALHQAIKRHEPTFAVKLDGRDLGIIIAADIVVIVAITTYSTLKVG
jgi:hypothetical protein